MRETGAHPLHQDHGMLASVLLVASISAGFDVIMVDDHAFPMPALAYLSGDREGPELEIHFSTLGVASLLDLGVRSYLGTSHVRPYFGLRFGGVLVGLVPAVPILTGTVGLSMGGEDSKAFEIEVGGTFAAIDEEGLGGTARVSLGFRF